MFLANFRILGIKNNGADPCLIRYALASVGQWSSFTKCEIFQGATPLSSLAFEKADFEWVEKRSHFLRLWTKVHQIC